MIRFLANFFSLFVIIMPTVLFFGCSSIPTEQRIKEDIIKQFKQSEAIIGVWRYNITDIQIHGTSKNQDRLEVLVSFVIEGNYSGGYTRGYEKAYRKIVMFYKKFGKNWEYEDVLSIGV